MVSCPIPSLAYLLEKIGEAEEEISSTTTSNKIDSGMSSHSYQREPRQAGAALQLWKAKLKRFYPDCYNRLYGSGFVRYRGKRRV